MYINVGIAGSVLYYTACVAVIYQKQILTQIKSLDSNSPKYFTDYFTDYFASLLR